MPAPLRLVITATPETLLPNSAGILPVIDSAAWTMGHIERVGEGAGQLIADRQPVDDKRHLVVGASRMNRAVGVLGEAGKADETDSRPRLPRGAGMRSMRVTLTAWRLPAEVTSMAAVVRRHADAVGHAGDYYRHLAYGLRLEVAATRRGSAV